jgi:hypothetical protein
MQCDLFGADSPWKRWPANCAYVVPLYICHAAEDAAFLLPSILESALTESQWVRLCLRVCKHFEQCPCHLVPSAFSVCRFMLCKHVSVGRQHTYLLYKNHFFIISMFSIWGIGSFLLRNKRSADSTGGTKTWTWCDWSGVWLEKFFNRIFAQASSYQCYHRIWFTLQCCLCTTRCNHCKHNMC